MSWPAGPLPAVNFRRAQALQRPLECAADRRPGRGHDYRVSHALVRSVPAAGSPRVASGSQRWFAPSIICGPEPRRGQYSRAADIKPLLWETDWLPSWLPNLQTKSISDQSGRRDLNPRPLDPQSSALPSWATSRCARRTHPPNPAGFHTLAQPRGAWGHRRRRADVAAPASGVAPPGSCLRDRAPAALTFAVVRPAALTSAVPPPGEAGVIQDKPAPDCIRRHARGSNGITGTSY